MLGCCKKFYSIVSNNVTETRQVGMDAQGTYMDYNVRKSLHYYYSTICLIILVSIISGAYYLWHTGSLNLDNISSVYESGLMLEDIKTTQSPSKLKRLVETDRVREGLNLLTVLEKNSQDLNRNFPTDSFDSFMLDHRRVRKQMKQLIAYPKQEMIIVVLRNKVESFRDFVRTNQWRTLSRMANIMRLRLSAKSVKSPSFFTAKKINIFIKKMKQDIKRMAKITDGSVLGLIDKNDINKRLDALNVEVKMLEEYAKNLDSFFVNQRRVSKSFKQWTAQVAPEITLKRMHFEKTGQYLKIFLIGVVAFLILAMVCGFLLEKYTRSVATKKIEKMLLTTINDGLIPIDNKLDQSKLSQNFTMEFEKLREYFHRRISFGSVFQEALPFSSLLLDSNLNLTWANDLFFEQWNITDKQNYSDVTWDSLQRFTNLGEDDPVLMALRDGIAGIYQVQVKSPATEESLPFEMYVSPVEYSGQKRIMIFFYPLRNLEETLTNQVQSITGPISRLLDEMTHGTLKAETKEKLESDFMAAGIDKLFTKFSDFSDKNNNFRESMCLEMTELEKHYYDQVKLVSDVRLISNEKTSLHHKAQNHFKNFKSSVVKLVELRYELEASLEENAALLKDTAHKQSDLINIAEESLELHGESVVSLDKIAAAKDQLKELKEHMDRHRSSLTQYIDQTLISIRRNNPDPHLEGSLGKIKQESKNIEDLLQDYTQVTRQLDVLLSKASMVMEQKNVPDLDAYKNEIGHLGSMVEESSMRLQGLCEAGESLDGHVVESLRTLYANYNRLSGLDEQEMEVLVRADSTNSSPEAAL